MNGRRTHLKLVRDVGYNGAVTCELVSDGTGLFVVFNGEQIAKLGEPHTPQDGTWVNLVPGYSVIDNFDGELTVCEQGE